MSDPLARDFLAHHGVKGMHWGVRKGKEHSSEPTDVRVEQHGVKTPKASGGNNHPAHQNALDVAAVRQKAKASGLHSLSNAELKTANERLNLETNFSRLNATTQGSNFVSKFLLKVGGQQANTAVNKVAEKRVTDFLKEKGLV